MRTSIHLMLLAAPLALAACDGDPDQGASDNRAIEGDESSVMGEMSAATKVGTTGKITAIDAEADTVTIDHAPVPELNWPEMVMAFEIGEGLQGDLAVGDEVSFEFLSGDEGNVITSIAKQ